MLLQPDLPETHPGFWSSVDQVGPGMNISCEWIKQACHNITGICRDLDYLMAMVSNGNYCQVWT